MTPPQSRERVLVVDEDWGVLDLIARQVLEPLGYSTASARDTDGAIQQALSFDPDLIIASLTLPGLSGKDLIVALRSRGVEAPVLVTANEGMEADVIQAFRLGARNYLVKPLREAELAAAVEQALNDDRFRKERKELADQLAISNLQLEQRVRELTTLFGIGKAVSSTISLPQLFTMLVDEGVTITNAEMGWILLRDDLNQTLMLRAQRGFPPPVADELHSAWDDGISSLAIQSGKVLSMHGEPLRRFELGLYATSAMVSPITVHSEHVGVIGVARENNGGFEEREEAMLAAVADYASISLVNARLYQALATRAKKLEQVLDDRREGVRVQPSWLEALGERLSVIRQQLAQVSQASRSPKAKAKLKSIGDMLEGLAKDVADTQQEFLSDSNAPTPETP
jgi:two-component system NtrC family sensor kinase